MAVRAKFKVNAIRFSMGSRKSGRKDENGRDVYEPCKMATIEMSPVYANGDPNHENSKFWDASPGGKLELNCVNAAAVEQLELDREFYVDFTPAPE